MNLRHEVRWSKTDALSWCGLRGCLIWESENVRLQPPERQITAGESERQTDHAGFRHRHDRLCRIERHRSCGLRAAWNRVIVCERRSPFVDWPFSVARQVHQSQDRDL